MSILNKFLNEITYFFCPQNGRSPLLLAAAAGHVDVCETLLLREIDINAADNVSNH